MSYNVVLCPLTVDPEKGKHLSSWENQPGKLAVPPQTKTRHESRMVFGAPSLQLQGVSLIAQLVKKPPTMQETPVATPGLGRSPGEGIG